MSATKFSAIFSKLCQNRRRLGAQPVSLTRNQTAVSFRIFWKHQRSFTTQSARANAHTMADTPNPQLLIKDGLRVAVEGCGHGALNPIYSAVGEACKARGWPGVDLVIICGDFQATRNGHDVEVMSVPSKYRVLGDFHEYYSGARQAPYLTLFIAGNHEAAAYLWELYYGGWVAPNIYYMGAANVLRLGPLRIAGLSGIWKGFDYRKTHCERLPFSRDDIKSFYHVREFDVRKLLQVREQVDVGISHDWPRGIEKHGDVQQLYRTRPMWKQESLDGVLGSVPAEYVMDRLRPAYWFSAHMHWKFAAIKSYPPPTGATGAGEAVEASPNAAAPAAAPEAQAPATVEDPNEIDLDMDDDEPSRTDGKDETTAPEATTGAPSTAVSEDLRAQLPASFAKPKPGPKGTPGQPVPQTITNTQVRFLALNKCEPGRDFLQVCDLHPVDPANFEKYPPSETAANPNQRYTLQYDPEWLSISRAFHPLLSIGDRSAAVPPNEGEEAYLRSIAKEREWVEENIVSKGKLEVPHNFAQTAPPLEPGSEQSQPQLWSLHSGVQPREYTNPQTASFCDLMGLTNLWAATEEEREERRQQGPPPEDMRGDRGGRGGRGGGFGKRGGRGGFGRGGGRARGGGGRGRGLGRDW